MKKKNYKEIYQFKITLKGIKPLIWRRIHVPETYSFWDLHVAIQDCMGWSDSHLHQFTINNPQTGVKEFIGIPDKDYDEIKVLPGWNINICDYFTLSNKKSLYNYDFGDDWNHEIQLEKILLRDNIAIKFPLCIDGARKCPPEDCGGVFGYKSFLRIIKNPNHEEYEDTLTWVGGKYNPDDFNPNKIKFSNPTKRFKFAFGS